jgi:Transglutaminase-like superfamily
MLDRRNFLKSAVSVAALGVGAIPATADPFAPSDHGDWRAYEIRTIVEIDSTEPVRIWAPAAAFDAPDWSRPLGTNWTGNADFAEIVRDPAYGAEFVHLDWRAGSGGRRAEIVSRVAARDRAVDLRAGKSAAAHLGPEERALFTKATALMPTDGIVKETSDRIVAGATSDLDKARAIYNWLVANTERIAATRGCGSGDIKAMLAAEKLGGKCADINGLFVGLARAAGLPARDLYGIRVAPSRFGYKSLGVASTDVTKGPALPGRRLARGDRLDPDGCSRRPEGHVGGAADPSERGGAQSRRRARNADRIVRRQLGRVQLRARRRVARRLGRPCRLSHVS